jgi:hypothetical protein
MKIPFLKMAFYMPSFSLGRGLLYVAAGTAAWDVTDFYFILLHNLL